MYPAIHVATKMDATWACWLSFFIPQRDFTPIKLSPSWLFFHPSKQCSCCIVHTILLCNFVFEGMSEVKASFAWFCQQGVGLLGWDLVGCIKIIQLLPQKVVSNFLLFFFSTPFTGTTHVPYWWPLSQTEAASGKITPKLVDLHYHFFVGLHWPFLFCGFTLQLFILRVFILSPFLFCWFSVAQQLLFSLVQKLFCVEGAWQPLQAKEVAFAGCILAVNILGPSWQSFFKLTVGSATTAASVQANSFSRLPLPLPIPFGAF